MDVEKIDDGLSFERRLSECVKMLSSLSGDIEDRLSLLREKEKAYTELQERMKENAEKQSKQIYLDIGGKIFSASRETLTSVEGTYFYAMLASNSWKPNERGCYFIDRDPTHFERIMTYLRTKEMKYDGLSEEQLQELEEELDYYQIIVEDNLWKWDSKRVSHSIVMSNKGKTVSKLGFDGHWDGAAISMKPLDSFKVRVQKENPSARACLGFITSDNFDLKGDPLQRGYWLGVKSGNLSSKDYAGKQYSTPIGNDSIIQVKFDRQKGEIRYIVDGNDKGVAFAGIPLDIVLHPCVYFCDRFVTFEIVK
eukprot:TRINITY_DN4860_c0_g1_i2.p1 TRINITY_DN4860_c0_g1~~TRINITY_DN4860_c0_g1_i2.p1  ORF type:complete len:309 (-),score=89.29 TRINITY_DN4860_c0_g1_i2:4-930(-)